MRRRHRHVGDTPRFPPGFPSWRADRVTSRAGFAASHARTRRRRRQPMSYARSADHTPPELKQADLWSLTAQLAASNPVRLERARTSNRVASA